MFFQQGYGTCKDDKASTNAANTSLIRRFNQHSTMVLRACDSNDKSPLNRSNSNNITMNGDSNSRSSTPVSLPEVPVKKVCS